MLKHRFSFLVLLFSISFLSFAETKIGDNTALVVIDMQDYFIKQDGNHEDPKNKEKINEIINYQINLIEVAKQKGMPIVFVEYNLKGWATKGTETNTKLKQAAGDYKNLKYFLKDSNGIFGSTNNAELTEYLNDQKVGNLIIIGANGGSCVQASIWGALKKNYNVIADNRGIADFNFKEYIYPYKNIYNIKPICTSCFFKEVGSISELHESLLVAQLKNREIKSQPGRDDSLRGESSKDFLESEKKAKQKNEVLQQ